MLKVNVFIFVSSYQSTGTLSAIDCLYVIETDSQIKYNDVGVSSYKPERYYDRDIRVWRSLLNRRTYGTDGRA